MTLTKTLTGLSASDKSTALMSVLFVAVLGVMTLFVTSTAGSAVLHDAAHDVRHATGFPCH